MLLWNGFAVTFRLKVGEYEEREKENYRFSARPGLVRAHWPSLAKLRKLLFQRPDTNVARGSRS